jgi:phospholipid/cholesterol/gamma-HCH transport system substrate-binding protein
VDGSERASERGASTPARIIAALAVACGFVLVAVLLFGGSDEGHKYKFMFETGGQLVPGNQVLIAGQPVGTINSIDLTDNAQAEVDVTLDRTLTEGSTVVIRTTSLSGVANRYVSLSMGPDNAEEIPEGETLSGTDTTSPVDLDQLFNIFRKKERESLQKFISGNATIYAGKGQLANRAYKFLNPALSTSQRLFDELSSDSLALSRFLVSGSKTFGAIAERSDDLSSLVTNGNTALQAIEDENTALERTLDAAPDALRQANTTFVNLRATLDDLDPLVAASYPATENLAPFLRNFETLATESRPVFRDLADVVDLPGKNNDLAETLKLLPRVEKSGSTAFPASVRAMNVSQDNFAFIRPYTPDLFGLLGKLGQATSYFDANGHYARVTPAATNVFEYDGGTNTLVPNYNDRTDQFDPLDTVQEMGVLRPCPGGGTEVAPDGSNPFLDDGNLTIADCDPGDTFPVIP